MEVMLETKFYMTQSMLLNILKDYKLKILSKRTFLAQVSEEKEAKGQGTMTNFLRD